MKAVNTVKKVDDKLEGYNTDWWAIYYLTKQSLQRNNYGGDYSDLVAVVVGAGGTGLSKFFAFTINIFSVRRVLFYEEIKGAVLCLEQDAREGRRTSERVWRKCH